MSDFLPKEYKDNKTLNESSGGYMKFTKGTNRFRIMGSPIVGWEWWEETEDGKRLPKRVRINEKLDVSKISEPESIKRFWAMVVFNYELNSLQILEITQRSIQKTLENLVADEDWGSPVQSYDIVVTRVGEGMETKYEALPKPKSKMDKGIIELYKATPIRLEALFEGTDPFGKDITQTDIDKIAEEI